MGKAFRRLAAAAACVLMLCLAASALAGPLADTIYVAGNAALYPLEYYERGRWRGAFPDLLEQISEVSGLEFVYLPPLQGVDQRQRAANMQAELISCLIRGDGAADSGLCLTQPLYILRTQDGGEQEICFALTELMPQKQGQRFLEALEQCRSETAVLITEDMRRRPASMWTIAACVLCLGAVSGLLIWRFRRLRAETSERHVVDEKTLLENIDSLPPLCRSLWYLALLPAGDQPVEAQQLLPYIGEESMPAVLDNGDAALFFSAVDDQHAVRQIDSAMQTLGAPCAAVLPLSETEMAAETMLHCVRQAAKTARKQRSHILVCSAALLRQISDRELLRSQLRSAIHSGQFMLYVQPIVSGESGRIIGAEALSRWDHLKLGFMTPGRFIELVHEMELELEFDKSQLERVCAELRSWRAAGIERVGLHCNVSRRTLSDPGFVDWLLELVHREEVDRSALVVELTEEEMGDLDEIYRNLRRLHAAGISLALDDYGTMATREEDLRQRLFDKVKVDASLLRRATSPEGERALHTALELIHAGGAQAICEGVETQEQAALLRRMGCDAFQGFLYYRPMPNMIARRTILEQMEQDAGKTGTGSRNCT